MYWHGQALARFRRGTGRRVLTAFNPHLLIQMKEASPATLTLAATLTAMYCYGRHFRVGVGTARFYLRGGGASWVILGGLAMGLALLSMGGIGLFCVPVIVLHQAYLRSEMAPPGAAKPPLVRLVEQP